MNTHDAWYAANLECKRLCNQFNAAIHVLEGKKLAINEEYPKILATRDLPSLRELAKTHGRAGEEISRCKKQIIIDWLVEQRLGAIDLEIADLRKKIEDSAPSPYWQEVQA